MSSVVASSPVSGVSGMSVEVLADGTVWTLRDMTADGSEAMRMDRLHEKFPAPVAGSCHVVVRAPTPFVPTFFCKPAGGMLSDGRAVRIVLDLSQLADVVHGLVGAARHAYGALFEGLEDDPARAARLATAVAGWARTFALGDVMMEDTLVIAELLCGLVSVDAAGDLEKKRGAPALDGTEGDPLSDPSATHDLLTKRGWIVEWLRGELVVVGLRCSAAGGAREASALASAILAKVSKVVSTEAVVAAVAQETAEPPATEVTAAAEETAAEVTAAPPATKVAEETAAPPATEVTVVAEDAPAAVAEEALVAQPPVTGVVAADI